MPLDICSKTECSKPISNHKKVSQCISCFQRFHPKCSLPCTDLYKVVNNNIDFFCSTCREQIFPFNNIETEDLFGIFNENVFKDSIVSKKCKCAECKKYIKKNNPAAHCHFCSDFFHLKCQKLSKPDFPLPLTWCCSFCILKNLPFSKITDDNMTMTLHGMDDEYISTLDTDQFMSEGILSKYYTIDDFSNAKFSNNKFKKFHLNIASLQKHIHELRTLLSCSEHNFDILCISETRLHDELSIVNVEIDGYEFIHTPTLTQCGGAGMYIKNGIDFSIVQNLTESHEDICESIFIEIKLPTKRNILIGSIYRHHSPVETFIDTFFRKTLEQITKSKKKMHFCWRLQR